MVHTVIPAFRRLRQEWHKFEASLELHSETVSKEPKHKLKRKTHFCLLEADSGGQLVQEKLVGLEDSSVVESTGCSSKEPRFNFHLLYGG